MKVSFNQCLRINHTAVRYYATAIILALLFLFSCVHDPVSDPNQAEISFKNDVQLVLSGSCQNTGCHGAADYSEFPLITYNDVINYGEVKAGKPDKSKIYKSISGNGEEKMPPTWNLPDDQIQIVYNWILQGAKDN